MIELKNLTRAFGSLMAVDHVNLVIPKGQICGYLGPNGAGKTTTVKMLTGMIKPSSGSAEVAGYNIRTEILEVKRQIGYVPESGALYQSLTPIEYLEVVGRLYEMEEKEMKRRIEEGMHFFQLTDDAHHRMSGFSKGMRQKVLIASALIHNPHVIFLDEPLNGLDANTALLLKELLRNLANEGKTIFYCSHILEVVENLCDRVVILDRGTVVADGSVGALKKMTRRSSLAEVFGKLTHADDQKELARAFSKSISVAKNRET
jgi:ABC-2 type transport system ATP-binding protein